MKVETLLVTPFMQNARILWSEKSKRGVVVDPGGEAEIILEALERLGVTCEAIWLTHSHLDHCGAVAPLIEKLKVPLYAHPAERIMRSKVVEISRMYGLPDGILFNCPEPDHEIVGGEVLQIDGESCKVLFTPGHAPGHVCFYFKELGELIAGDTVFAGAIGRTDLPGGDYDTLISSIRTEILSLPDETIIRSGHGPDTTVGAERKTNPFLMRGAA